MAELILPRRKFLMGAAALFAAPAIVRASSLMPVKSMPTGTTLATFEREYLRYLEGMAQKITEIYYGNSEWSPVTFTGFIPNWGGS